MKPLLIKLAYRQVIDRSMTTGFAKGVLKASHDEFLLKSQAYNREGKFKTFTEMVANDGRANSLHYKCGFAIGQWIKALNGRIPGVLDGAHKPVPFILHRFELLESDTLDGNTHRAAIIYETDVYTWFGTIGNQLVIASGNVIQKSESAFVETSLLTMTEPWTISGIQCPLPSVEAEVVSAHRVETQYN